MKDKIIAFLEIGPSRAADIAVALNMPVGNVRKALSAMVKSGRHVVSNGRTPATYELVRLKEKPPKGEVVRPYPLNACPEPLKLDLRSHESLCMLVKR